MQFTPQFNTHQAVKNLVAAGLKEPIAEVVVDTIIENNTSNLANVATKADIDKLEFATKTHIDKLESATKTNIDKLDSKIDKLEFTTKASIEKLEFKMQTEIEKAKNDTIKWVVGSMFAIAGIMIAILKTNTSL
jgi:Fe2+ transport system protein B